MAQQMIPAVGNWYKTLDDEVFEVIAVDEDDGTIEIQYRSGDIEELDIDDWNQLVAGPGEPAEDWSTGFDNDEEPQRFDDLDNPARPDEW